MPAAAAELVQVEFFAVNPAAAAENWCKKSLTRAKKSDTLHAVYQSRRSNKC
jgi:hypothetical protein